MRRRLGAHPLRVHRLAATVHDVVVKRVLDPPARVGDAIEALGVGLVVREQKLGGALPRRRRVPPPLAERLVFDADAVAVRRQARLAPVPLALAAPGPRVARPQGRQEVQRRGVGAAVRDRDTNEDIVDRGLGVFRGHVEVEALVEDAGVSQLELRLRPAAAAVLLDQTGIGELGLRVLVQPAHVGMRRRRVEVEVALLDVLAVVAFRPGQTEEPLLENRIASVPKGEGEAQPPLSVADAEQAVLSPAVGAAARVLVREVRPARPVGRVVLAHRSPLPLREVGSPALPVADAGVIVGESLPLGGVSGCGHGSLLAEFDASRAPPFRASRSGATP